MAKTGILDYQRYLNTLQTLNDLGQTFPSNQQTYTFTVAGGGTASWPATISWKTLVLDKVSFSSKETGYIPNVDASQVIGYVDGGTSTQYSTGVISIPAGMYTGPILPGGDFNVPLTVVQIEWFDGTTTYAQQIGFIQNWEPGVEIGDPTEGFDYHPVYSLPSTLTLTGQAGLLYGDNLTLTATSDIPLDLTGLKCRFFKKTGDVLLGEGTFSGSSANFTITTVGNFAIGTHEVYAVSPPFKNFLTARSNDFTITVADGIPLIVTTSTFTPSQAYYYVGETVTYNLGVIANPAFTATGVAIANTVTIKLVNVFSPFTETPVVTTNFVNGQTSNPFTIQSYMVDLNRADPRTTYSITTSSYNTTTYTATLFVSNTETVVSSWDSQFVGRYAGGSTSTLITVAGTATVTVQGNAFPITITQDSNNTYLDDEFNITVSTPNVAYYNNITIYANKGATTITLYSTNSSGTSSFIAPINTVFASTGTWTIYAAYPGDLSSSIVNANLPATSNSLSHFIRDGNTLLPTPKLNFYRNASNDILQVTASTSTTLTNVVSFYEGTTLLGTAEWIRSTGTNYSILSENYYHTQSGFARNFEILKGPLQSTQGTITEAERAVYMSYLGPQYYVSNTPGGLSDSYPYAVDYRDTGGTALAPYLMGSMTPIGWAKPVRFPSTTDAQWNYWANDIVSAATDPGKRYRGPWGVNPNMTELNSVQGGFAYPKFPNKYTLLKYYDGTNYNLNNITGTNITEIADPIVFNTTWTLGPVTGTGRESYRWDTIGDTRGYNVVALNASTSTQRPLSIASTERLYFQGSTGTRYIDLVEFIGTATWSTQANSSANFPSGPTTSTISVWLYKFTPTIPQTNTEFKTNYPLLEAMEKCGGYALDAGKAHENWVNYGKKSWVSTNTNSAAANDLAQFYNDWFAAFTNPLGNSIYVNQLGPVGTQTATLTLPVNTINTVSNVHAIWTGTQNLNKIYGKYFGFDIPVSDTPTTISLTAYSTGPQQADGSITLWEPGFYVRGNMNPSMLVATVGFVNTSSLNSTATISGNVSFYYGDTGWNGQIYSEIRTLGTATVSNNVAKLNIHAFNFIGQGTKAIYAVFEGTNKLAASSSTVLGGFVNGDISNPQGQQILGKVFSYPGLTTQFINTLTYATLAKDVYLNGTLTISFPWCYDPSLPYGISVYFSNRIRVYYSLNEDATLYLLTTFEGRSRKQGPGYRDQFAQPTGGYNYVPIPFTNIASQATAGEFQGGTVNIYVSIDEFPNYRFPYGAYVNFQPNGVYFQYR